MINRYHIASNFKKIHEILKKETSSSLKKDVMFENIKEYEVYQRFSFIPNTILTEKR